MKLIRIGDAARMLGVDAQTLRRKIKGDYLEIYGHRLRVYRTDLSPTAERRFNGDEIARVIARMGR